ncbi:MAG TPA: hypothetical protein VE476_04030, partial [Propionibacteriaceae bacterium]|nr:hypothetical protein [Propionibacteriaceae bacterium]
GHPVGYRQDPSPDLPYARDVKYDRYGLIVELDGRLGHEAEGRFRDMNPDNRHALRDELTLPSATSMSVADLVRWRSRSIWPWSSAATSEPFRRCRNCVNVSEAHLTAA